MPGRDSVGLHAALAHGLSQHPLRLALIDEIHARPYEVLRAPLGASHLAVQGAAGLDHIARLCARLGMPAPHPGANFHSGDFGKFRLRWEAHAEFSTITVFTFDEVDEPFATTALTALPDEWLAQLGGEVLVAVHLAVLPATHPDIDLTAAFAGNPVIGSRVLGGAARAWTDFRLHGDGFARMLIADEGLTAGQTGRLVQRLLEIETYRMMALLAFPLAREAAPQLSRIDRDLGVIVEEIAAGSHDGDDRPLLDQLTRLAAECERISALTSFRLSAARAYYAIVRQRIAELREERIPGLQTIDEFMSRRLGPAMSTCQSTGERQDALAARVARAGSLLRTRVDIALEEKNRDLLASMNRRARLQLRLQETVEGLSVVAISYYLLGLVGYVAKGIKAAGAPINADAVVLGGVPVVIGLVWLGVRRLRKAIGRGGE